MSDVEKVEIGLATLYRGDCLAVTQILGKITHTITDPPYEAGAHTADRLVGGENGPIIKAHKFESMDDFTRDQITKFMAENTEKWSLIFCQNEGAHFWREALRANGIKPNTTMVWCKPDGKPNFNGTGPGVGYEAIVTTWHGEGRSSWNGGGKLGIFNVNKTEKKDDGNIHTTIKPQKLMAELIELFTDKEDIILDCFMGSGSTGVAAVNAGRRFIGIEKDADYFEICCKRIEAAQKSDLINTSVYVKMKAKVIVPLFEVPEKPTGITAGVKKVAAPKPRGKIGGGGSTPTITMETGNGSKRANPVAVKRFSVPAITVEGAAKPTAKREQIPFINPFAEACRARIAEAGGRPMVFDNWEQHINDRLILDVECYRNFFIICFQSIKDGKRYVFERSTRTDFSNKFVEKILKENRVITFNGMTYDIPMIYLALKGASTVELKQASNKIIQGKMNYWEAERELKVSIPLIDHIDLKEPNPSIKTGLKIIGARLHGRYVVDLPYEESSSLDGDQMNYTTLYCFNDIDETKRLYEAIAEPMELRRTLSKEFKIDLRSKSDAQVGEAIFKKLIGGTIGKSVDMATFHYKIPEFIRFEGTQMREVLVKLAGTEFNVDPFSGKTIAPDWLEGSQIKYGRSLYSMGKGGLHSTESNRALHSNENSILIDLDVTGHYPRTGLKIGLYPKAAGPKYLTVGQRIVDERTEAKQTQQKYDKLIKTETDVEKIAELKVIREPFKIKAEGFKIAANGAMFGKLGSKYSFLYSPDILFAVTMTGQLTVLMLIERFERAGIPVVSGNTDGIVALCPRAMVEFNDKKEMVGGKINDIIKEWEEQTGFNLEYTPYKSIYNSSVNTYIAIKDGGGVKMKGPAGNPWAENDIRNMIMKNPQMTICGEAVVQYILNQTPLEETILNCTDPRMFVTVIKVDVGAKWREHYIGRAVRYYWSIDGDPILYSGSGRKVAKTDGARPLIELTDKIPEDLNRARYIEEANKIAIDMAVIEDKGALI